MELLDTILAFVAWLWFWVWRISLGLFLFVVLAALVTSTYKKRKMRKYISHPVDWLTVMSTERWVTREELAEMMNVICKIELFKVSTSSERFWKFAKYKHVIGLDFTMIADDLKELAELQLIERRIVYYDKQGNEFPGGLDFFVRDSSGGIIGFDKALSDQYLRRDEYRKTAKGGGIKSKGLKQDRNVNLPNEDFVPLL